MLRNVTITSRQVDIGILRQSVGVLGLYFSSICPQLCHSLKNIGISTSIYVFHSISLESKCVFMSICQYVNIVMTRASFRGIGRISTGKPQYAARFTVLALITLFHKIQPKIQLVYIRYQNTLYAPKSRCTLFAIHGTISLIMTTNSSISRMRTAAVIQAMKEKRYDPLKELIDIAMKADTPRDEKIDIAKSLMKYAYPQLKHVEVDAQVNHGLTVQVRQFVKPDSVIGTEKEDAKIAGHGQPIGIPASAGTVVDVGAAALPVGAGGHPDIIPDPELPTKRKAE